MTKKFFSALAAIALLALSACTQEELDKFLNSVNSIKLDQTQVEMTVGETLHLIATVDPFKGDTKVVTWTSSSPDVASVKGTEIPDVVGINMPAGEVTALKEGETTITAKAGDKTATCKVIVKKKADDNGGNGGDGKVEATSITLNKTEITLVTGLSEQLEIVKILPENVTDKNALWVSSNPDVAVVIDKDAVVDGVTYKGGRVTGRDLGEATITAYLGTAKAECKVTVVSGGGGDATIESLVIDPAPVTLAVDEEQVLTAVMKPSGAKVNVEWKCDKPEILAMGAINDTQAKIQGLANGKATVTAYAGGKTATCEVTVTGGAATVPVTSITLDHTQLNMTVGQKAQLIATVLPENATDKTLNWSVMDNRIVSVDGNGELTAQSVGSTTVTVISVMYPSVQASCQVTVTNGSTSDPGEEVVDLGLPSGLKWRGWNVGASKPEEYGNYYAWAETSPKSSYSSSNYKYKATDYGDGIIVYAKYDTTPVQGDGKTVLEPEDDAATANLGNGWRTPTFKEFKELRENCTWTWKTQNGVNGMLVTGPNGKSIFLPAGGWYDKTTLSGKTTYGSYWTASGSGGNAHAVDFANGYVDKAYLARPDGRSVRPVKD